VELDHVGYTRNVEDLVNERHRRDNADSFAEFGSGLMCAVMQDATFGRAAAFGPKALKVNERALARAVNPVLERGERDDLVVGLHAGMEDSGQFNSSVPSFFASV
jgi:hypothetical protein